MTPDEAIKRLIHAFPRPLAKVPTDVYAEFMARLTPVQLDRGVELSILRSKFFPKVAEFMAFAQGREPGHAGRERPGEANRATQALMAAERHASASERRAMCTRNEARIEAIRRDDNNSVGHSHFRTERDEFPSLDSALTHFGLDWRGEPESEAHRQPWETGRRTSTITAAGD